MTIHVYYSKILNFRFGRNNIYDIKYTYLQTGSSNDEFCEIRRY